MLSTVCSLLPLDFRYITYREVAGDLALRWNVCEDKWFVDALLSFLIVAAAVAESVVVARSSSPLSQVHLSDGGELIRIEF